MATQNKRILLVVYSVSMVIIWCSNYMNTCLEFVITNHHIEINCNLIKNYIEKIRKTKIYETIAQMCFNSQHNIYNIIHVTNLEMNKH